MPADAFFDTSVVVYAFGKDDPRSDDANQLIAAGGVISVQVLNEFVNVSRGKLKKDWPEIARGLASLRVLCAECLPLTETIHDAAVELAARYNFHIYDALMVAAALEAGCSTLYTEDLQDGQRIRGLTVRNPFRKRN